MRRGEGVGILNGIIYKEIKIKNNKKENLCDCIRNLTMWWSP